MNTINKSILVVGKSITTTNEEAQTQNTIGKLWDDFLKNPIKEKLGDSSSSSIFAVYSHYEDEHKGKYKITVGYAVNGINRIPNGLSAVMIPAGNYKIFEPKSRAPQDTIDAWKTIWAMDPNLFRRKFIADFEEYNDDRVMIHIGHE